MAITAADIWRDFETAGTPGSGAHKPIKADIRAWGSALENAGGITAPGVQLVPLFSNGVGVPAAYRPIVGFDLPNPSLAVPGAVFAKPGVAGQILAGLGTDGEFDLAAVTGTGSIVLSNNPNFTGTVSINGLTFLSSAGGTHQVIAPDGRLGFQMSGAPATNYYKADAHNFYNPIGSIPFATLDQWGWNVTPPPLTSGASPGQLNALHIAQTWNNGATVNNLLRCDLTDTASAIGSRIMLATVGGVIRWYVDKAGSGTYSGNLNIGGVIVVGGKNFSSVNGAGAIDRYNSSTGGGIRWLTESGVTVLEMLSNLGVRSYHGATSGQHNVSPPAAAAGSSTWPTTSGELVNTGTGLLQGAYGAAIDFNVANVDIPIPFRVASGITKFRFAGGYMLNTGPGAAALNTVQVALYTGPGGTGTAICLPQAIASITSNAQGTAGVYQNLVTNPALGLHWFDVATFSTVYARVTTAQGAAAAGRVGFIIQPYA
jgi:hypothetical protein